MKIAVAGAGYVGVSLAVLLSQKHEVVVTDVVEDRISKINNKISPIADDDVEDYLVNKTLNIRATMDSYDAYKDAKYVIVAVSTNYDNKKDYFRER